MIIPLGYLCIDTFIWSSSESCQICQILSDFDKIIWNSRNFELILLSNFDNKAHEIL